MDARDGEYFRALVQGVCDARDALDAQLAGWLDRKPRRCSIPSSTRCC